MSQNYKVHETQHLRLAILKFLHEDADYSINDSLLRDAIGHFGFSPSRDALRTQLRWLEEQQLLTIEEVGNLLVAKLTERGCDVATGAAKVDGVKRPGP